jgi:hypothetical protein
VGGPGGGGRVHLTVGTNITPDVAPGALGNFNGTCGSTPINSVNIGNAGTTGVIQPLEALKP